MGHFSSLLPFLSFNNFLLKCVASAVTSTSITLKTVILTLISTPLSNISTTVDLTLRANTFLLTAVVVNNTRIS